jgi:hypothetical protein
MYGKEKQKIEDRKSKTEMLFWALYIIGSALALIGKTRSTPVILLCLLTLLLSHITIVFDIFDESKKIALEIKRIRMSIKPWFSRQLSSVCSIRRSSFTSKISPLISGQSHYDSP